MVSVATAALCSCWEQSTIVAAVCTLALSWRPQNSVFGRCWHRTQRPLGDSNYACTSPQWLCGYHQEECWWHGLIVQINRQPFCHVCCMIFCVLGVWDLSRNSQTRLHLGLQITSIYMHVYAVSGADGCIPFIMLADVCHCCYLLMFVWWPFFKTPSLFLSKVNKIQTCERFKRTLFIRTRQNQQLFGVIPFAKLQKQHLNNR